MPRDNTRVSQPGSGGTGVWVLIALLGVVLGGTYAVLHLGHRFAGTGDAMPTDPFEVFFGLLRGQVPWPGIWGWIVAAGLVVLITALVVVGWIVLRRGSGKRSRVDSAAARLGRGRDVESITEKAASRSAKRLGVESPGVPIGRALGSGKMLYGSWEDMHIDVWGPRTGKTTSRAIPAILEAPGAVIVTSNKRDVVDATRGPRIKRGEVWVFDPQGIADEEPTWWWNPLSFVTDEVKAAQMAEDFAANSRKDNAKTDAFFDPKGQSLVAALLLAAALSNRSILDVYTWILKPSDDTPIDVLLDHEYPIVAAQLEAIYAYPDKQLSGVTATAEGMMSFVTNRKTAQWLTSGPHDHRREFHPDEFVRSEGTLYSLSKEGKGSAGPAVTALTVAVIEAAEALATRAAGGRLSTPLLGVLDEAANVCRWTALPDLYSHYGSRGIVLMTILQSWSQGCGVWGEGGMKKLWSASNVKVYGGGVNEVAFLEDLSRTLGDYERVQRSSSYGARQGRSTSHQIQRERILDVAQLAAMPRGRALVLSSGNRPTLVRTLPWMTSPHAEAVKESIEAHTPRPEGDAS